MDIYGDKMQKQVDKSHYDFENYLDKRRWISMWHQVNEVVKLEPKSVLEIGPGPGIFKALIQTLGIHIETLDLDDDLKPDYVASVLDLPFEDNTFDLVCAFQMLEHLPFENSLKAFSEMSRIAKNNIVISLPNAAPLFPYSIYLPKIGSVNFSLPRPFFTKPHQFDGEHYWEINKKGFYEEFIKKELKKRTGFDLKKVFRVHENPYHQFFIFNK